MKIFLTFLIISIFIVPNQGHSECICPFQGDVNNSGALDIADLTYFVNYLFKNGSAPYSDADCPSVDRADLNCDSVVDISDLTYSVDFYFKGGDHLCNLCDQIILPEGDADSPDYLSALAIQLNLAYDELPSAFIYTNSAGHTTLLDSTYLLGDSTFFDSLRIHDNDSAFMFQILPITSEDSDMYERLTSETEITDGSQRNHPTITIPGNAGTCKENGSTVTCSPVTVNGNNVTFRGRTINFGSTFGYGPPSIAQTISNMLNNHPPMLSSSQITSSCSEGAYNVANCRILSLLKSRNYSYSNNGQTVDIQYVYRFSFSLCWIYDCPDGPQELEEFSSFTCSYTRKVNGVTVDSYTSDMFHHYTYP